MVENGLYKTKHFLGKKLIKKNVNKAFFLSFVMSLEVLRCSISELAAGRSEFGLPVTRVEQRQRLSGVR